MLGPESAERDITATFRIRTSGSFRLIHIDEYGVRTCIRTWPANGIAAKFFWAHFPFLWCLGEVGEIC